MVNTILINGDSILVGGGGVVKAYKKDYKDSISIDQRGRARELGSMKTDADVMSIHLADPNPSNSAGPNYGQRDKRQRLFVHSVGVGDGGWNQYCHLTISVFALPKSKSKSKSKYVCKFRAKVKVEG